MKAIKSAEFNFNLKAGDILTKDTRKKLKLAADKFNLSIFVVANYNGEITEIFVIKGWVKEFEQNIIKACVGSGEVEVFTSLMWFEDVKNLIYKLYKKDDNIFAYVNNKIVDEIEAVIFG